MQRYGAALLERARGLLTADLDPENAVAQTWFMGLRGASGYDVRFPIYPWLATICTRVCLRQRRGELAGLARLRTLWSRRHARPSGPGFEGGTLVRQALEALPWKDREILTLRYLFGLSYLELAQLLDLSHAALRARVTRALGRLRDGPHGGALHAILEARTGSDDDAI